MQALVLKRIMNFSLNIFEIVKAIKKHLKAAEQNFPSK